MKCEAFEIKSLAGCRLGAFEQKKGLGRCIIPIYITGRKAFPIMMIVVVLSLPLLSQDISAQVEEALPALYPGLCVLLQSL